MKSGRRIFLLLLCCALLCPAFAEGTEQTEDELPFFTEEALAEETLPSFNDESTDDDQLPSFGDNEAETESEPLPLPNPGNYFLEPVAQPEQSDFPFRGRVYDVYRYSQSLSWQEQLTAYLNAAENRGFTLSAERINGNNAYIITDDEKQALLFLNYEGSEKFMFMLEQGFEMEALSSVKTELELGDIFVTINGTRYVFSEKSMSLTELVQVDSRSTYLTYNHSWSYEWVYTKVLSADFYDWGERFFSISVPTDCKTADEYHLTKENTNSDRTHWWDVRLTLFGSRYCGGTRAVATGTSSYSTPKPGSYTAPSWMTHYYNEFSGEEDFLDVFVLTRSATEIRGELDGVFEDGKTVIKVEFWLPIL